MHLTFILFIIVLLESVFAYYSTECITLFTFLIVIKHVDIHFLENKDTKSSLQCALLCIIKIVQTYNQQTVVVNFGCDCKLPLPLPQHPPKRVGNFLVHSTTFLDFVFETGIVCYILQTQLQQPKQNPQVIQTEINSFTTFFLVSSFHINSGFSCSLSSILTYGQNILFQ